MEYIRWFDSAGTDGIGAGDVGVVGGKGANLGEMARAGLPVPPGFCLTAAAYRDFIRDTQLEAAIASILAALRPDDVSGDVAGDAAGDAAGASNVAAVEARSAQIRALIVEQTVPDAIAAEVGQSYRELAGRLGEPDAADVPVAVRSSATAEDLPTASFAGQQDTYLNVRGVEALLDHVKRCWASLWTARAVTYRNRHGFDHAQVYLAVVVQAMIESEVAGIMFTANPVTHNRDEVLLNASWGLGEAIVAGMVTPDTLTVRKHDGHVLQREVASKELLIAYAPDGGGTVELEVPADKRDAPALSDAQVAELVALGRQVEDHYGAPQDIEWGYAGGRFYVLQSRPITTLVPAAPQTPRLPTHGEYNRTMLVEIFPDPLSPIFLSVIQPLFADMLDFTFEALGFRPPQDHGLEAVEVFYNQPYFHRDYIAAALQPLSPPVRERLVAQIVNPFGEHEHDMQGELSVAYLGMVVRLLRFMTRFPERLPSVVAEYRAEVAEIAALPLEDVPDAEIVARVRRLVFGAGGRLLNYDFLMIALIGITYQMLGSLLGRHFGADTEELRAKLISGVTGNVTMETNKALWNLAQVAKTLPEVGDALHQGDDVLAELDATPQGQVFLDALERFLSRYGHREIRMDILYPTWGEDPTPVLNFVRSYLDADEAQSPHRQQARLVEQRQALTREAEARLGQDAVGRHLIAPVFRWVLHHTQLHTRERDTMHFELTRMFPPFRRLLLELGRRWSERGLIDQPDDIFFLPLDEMEVVARSPRDVRDDVARRRAAFEANQRRSPPGVIRDGDAVGAADAAPAAANGQLRGIAGSPGEITGVARVIRGPDDFGNLQNGEILVAPLTNPVWTPLFAVAGGVVTEVGGILSHGAIVAREYGIPAVMGVAGATTVVQDGQVVMVDGNKGLVGLAVG